MSERREAVLVRLRLRDAHGRPTGETVDVVPFKTLVERAHDESLRYVKTRLIQAPREDNRWTAIVRARVKTARGVFTGYGDANPENVDPKIAPHCVRMAETRAIARALRVGLAIAAVSLEELGSISHVARDEPKANVPVRETSGTGDNHTTPNGNGRPERYRGRDRNPTSVAPGDRRAMSDEQRKLLFRLAFDLGETRDTARDRVLKALGVERLEWAERSHASQAIDALRGEVAARKRDAQNGADHAPS